MDHSTIRQAAHDTIAPHIRTGEPLTGELRKNKGIERWTYTIDTRAKKPAVAVQNMTGDAVAFDNIDQLYDWAAQEEMTEFSIMLVTNDRH